MGWPPPGMSRDEHVAGLVSGLVVGMVVLALILGLTYISTQPDPGPVLHSVSVYSDGVLVREWDAVEIRVNLYDNGPLRVYDEDGVHYVRGEYVVGPAKE